MLVKKSDDVCIFIDGNNIKMGVKDTSKSTDAMPDYEKLIPKILNGRTLTLLRYYKEGEIVSESLTEMFKKGFGGTVKACNKTADGSIIIDSMLCAFYKSPSTIIIVSGDRDFIPLIQALKFMSINVEVASVSTRTNKAMIEIADYYHKLDNEYYTLKQVTPK